MLFPVFREGAVNTRTFDRGVPPPPPPKDLLNRKRWGKFEDEDFRRRKGQLSGQFNELVMQTLT